MRKNSCYIIAEIGINHDGKLSKALNLIDKAKMAGASAVKFQLFNPKTLGRNNDLRKIKIFKKKKSETRYEMWKRLRFKKNWIQKINNKCKKLKIDLGFSVFDEESFNLIKKTKPKFIKVASSDLTDTYLIKQIMLSKTKLILSTGMANIQEIKRTIKLLNNYNYVLLHCVSLYPTEYKKLNLLRMINLKKLHKHIGFSDHSISIFASIKAIELGAEVIEKHFTLNKNDDGPDHKCSANYEELKYICDYSKVHDQIIGKGLINPSRAEIKNRKNARKSIWAKKNIKFGEKFTSKNIEKTRPGLGIGPENFGKLLNKKSKYQFNKGDLIKI